MDFGFWNIINIVGSLAFFIFGMKMMSEGIQRAAGSQLRNILRAMTKNKYLGVFTGFLVTALVQSSSATTVMTVSFVNAGLLSLVESAGIMMGANIGTTVTGWIVSLLGFKMKLSAYSIPLFAIGVPLLFSKRGKLKYWGEFLIGFAILFLGLSELKNTVPDLKENTEALAWIQNIADFGFLSRVLFVFVGALVTIIVQSSSAAMAITLTLVYTGWLPLEVAAAMILGENIGTTITAEIASVVGNTNAKRSARIHSLFNVIGVTWMVILLPFILNFLTGFVESFSHIFEGAIKTKEADNQQDILNTYTLAAFHTTFNILNVLIMLPFTGWLVKMSIWGVKAKEGDGEEEESLKFIGSAIRTPELATIEVQKEVARFGEITSRMSGFTSEFMNSSKEKKQRKLLKKLSKYEKITDKFELEITEYVTKLANQEMTTKTSRRLRSYLNICNDLERIGDLFFQLSKLMERSIDEKIEFSAEQRKEIFVMIDLVDKSFKTMNDNISNPQYDNVDLKLALADEEAINKQRDKMKNDNLTRLGDPTYNVQSAMLYNSVFSVLEKIGDHIINVTEDMTGEEK